MTTRLANLAVVLAAVALCYGMQTSKPHYAELTGPIPAYGGVQDTVEARTFDVGVDKITFARTLKVDAFGKTKLLTTGGVWAIVTARLAAKDRSTIVAAAAWQGPTGLRYRTTERLSFASGLPPVALDPGLPGKGRFVFEIRPNEASDATLLVSRARFMALDSQARIALGEVALRPDGLPAAVVESYDMSQPI